MNKYFLGVLALFIAVAGYAGITDDQKHILNEQAGAAAQRVRLGDLVDQSAGAVSVVWDASTTNRGSSTLRTGVIQRTFGAHELGVTIPKKSLITRAWVDVTDAPVSFPNAGGPTGFSPGISFDCSTKTIGKTTVAFSSSTLYTGQGGQLLDLTAQNTLATFQRNDSTEDCYVRARIHGSNHTGGKMTLFVEYLQIR